ncbi:hypothetical protein PtA15_14A383 [Puccinia triticina]|uniref:Zn(2)-C6 fungal-type domain-containing protein n=1 Tax=Puccinia triticina TaxID=208348 RepID=A0ABY7D1N1_9BASI|nr:uncharacterized protein PtA15_14A383 [Puccinia triticina]WAQ91499.1 hypothetical protein PtA15_14A383 [Puccinia triticina]
MSGRLLFSQESPPGAKKRKRATNACLRCRLKKQRCDGISEPCGNCAKNNSECVFPDEIMGERFLRQHIANLEARVRELSSALKEIAPDHSVLQTTDAEVLSEQDLVDGFGFLSLTSGAEPLYVGGSSGASWGRIFSSALCNQTGEYFFFSESLIPPKTSPDSLSSDESLGSKLNSSYESSAPAVIDSSNFHANFLKMKSGFIFPPLPQDERLSDEIFATVFTTIQARHCFMNFVVLKKWYNERDKYCAAGQPLVADGPRTAAFFLWLTYALGLRLWEMRGRVIPGLPSHEYYFQAALQYYDHVSSNTTTIQALLFLAMYSFRSTKGLSTWHLTGLAMRTALELGLHRKTPKAQQLSVFHEETKKRIWWSVYALERNIAFQLGRPIAIREEEIDSELPLDIDCHITDNEQILARRVAIDKKLSETGTTLEINPYPLGWTTMTPSLHHLRLMRILTKIKEKIYHPRAAQETIEQRNANLESLASELDQWRALIPAKNPLNRSARNLFGLNLETHSEFQPETENGWDSGGIPFYTGEWFELQYHNAIQSLMIPSALTASPGSPYLHRAAHAAMAACGLQRKRLQKDYVAPLAVYSLHKLFMSGVFMLFALDKDPSLSITTEDACTKSTAGHSGLQEQDISPERHFASPNGISPQVFRQVKHCQEALSIYATHYPQAKPYAQCFENMSNMWLRRADRRDNRRDLSVQRHSSPERISENVLDANPALITRSLEDRFNPSYPPTLWKDDLNLPGRMRSNFEGSVSLGCDANLQVQSGSPPYHLLSLGPVEPNCEPFQLLNSEWERYELQKPWMLGRIQGERPNDFIRDISEQPGPNFSPSNQPYPSDLRNSTATFTDSVRSFLPENTIAHESQVVYNFQDHQGKISEYSPGNDAFNDETFQNSSSSTTEAQNLEVPRRYPLNSGVSPSFNNEQYSTKVPEEVQGNLRKQSFTSQQTFFGEEIKSTADSNIDGFPSFLANRQNHISKLAGEPCASSDTLGGGLPSDIYDTSQRSRLSSNSWLGEAFEFTRNTNDLSLLGRAQVPEVNLGSSKPTEVQVQNDEYSSPLSMILSEDLVQKKALVTDHRRSTLDSSDQQDLQNCIKILLAGKGDYSKLANNQYSKLSGDLMSSDQDDQSFCKGLKAIQPESKAIIA